jgi:hypothetical protein
MQELDCPQVCGLTTLFKLVPIKLNAKAPQKHHAQQRQQQQQQMHMHASAHPPHLLLLHPHLHPQIHSHLPQTPLRHLHEVTPGMQADRQSDTQTNRLTDNRRQRAL